MFWPTVFAAVVFYGGSLLLIFLYHLVRAPLKVIAKQGQQITELNHKLGRVEARQITTGQQPIAPAPEGEPNIVCLGTEYLLGSGNESDIFREGEEDALFIVATFCNQEISEREISSIEYVQASLVYENLDRETRRIHQGMWMDEEYTWTLFYTGDVRQLIIALKEHDDTFLAIQNNHESTARYKKPTYIALDANRYEVKVTLTTSGRILKEFNFRLILDLDNDKIELIYIKDETG